MSNPTRRSIFLGLGASLAAMVLATKVGPKLLGSARPKGDYWVTWTIQNPDPIYDPVPYDEWIARGGWTKKGDQIRLYYDYHLREWTYGPSSTDSDG